MQLGDKQNASDAGVALRNEQGTFLVWGPGGQVDKYICAPGASIASVTFHETREARNNYLIEKIAEDVSTPAKAHTAGSSR